MKKKENPQLTEFFNYEEFNFSNISHFFFTCNVVGSTHQYIDHELEKKYDINTIKENRRSIASFFDLPEENLALLRQFHTNKVEIVKSPWPIYKEPTADSLVTKKPNVILAVQTADCVPVLFADPKHQVIAATHAGWRGARAGILENTISSLLEAGAKKANLVAAIGPCIHQDNYEISQDFYEHFMKETPNNEQFFRQSQFSYKYYFDLPGYITYKLNKFNIKVVNHHLDTYSNPNNFFSFRRSKIEPSTSIGKLISAIIIRE